jgi:hypothetical protein
MLGLRGLVSKSTGTSIDENKLKPIIEKELLQIQNDLQKSVEFKKTI